MSPTLIYGTAWKKEDTVTVTAQALAAGFRAIDTANQRRHYREDLVGQALKNSLDAGLSRSELFLQSKYTYARGQDTQGWMPYRLESPIAEQVQDSFASSLKHLGTDYLDSYLLHGPQFNQGVSRDDWEAWESIEKIHANGKARMIGLSNVHLSQLEEWMKKAKIKPQIVQNRCYAIRGWDQEVRDYCRDQGIIYQGFSLLTANRELWESEYLSSLSRHYQKTPAQIVLRFSQWAGIVVLTGTTRLQHMLEDLEMDRKLWDLEEEHCRSLLNYYL